MAVTEQDIVEFATGMYWKPRGKSDDLFDDLRIAGDDGDDFLMAFAERFSVDMSGFLWYFHFNANEPPGLRDSFPYNPEGERLERIPLTPELFARAANLGRWPCKYPEHEVRLSRLVWIPLIFTIAVILCGLVVLAFVN